MLQAELVRIAECSQFSEELLMGKHRGNSMMSSLSGVPSIKRDVELAMRERQSATVLMVPLRYSMVML